MRRRRTDLVPLLVDHVGDARADGSLALAEPARVADELIVQRERVAKAWAAALAETGPGRASLLAADLEGQLNAPDAPS